MGNTRDLLKKISSREGSFHAKMGLTKDRNAMDLKEAEYIKKRLKEYIEELYKKDIFDRDNHDGVITHRVTDILASKVKSALEGMKTNKLVQVMELQLTYFKS